MLTVQKRLLLLTTNRKGSLTVIFRKDSLFHVCTMWAQPCSSAVRSGLMSSWFGTPKSLTASTRSHCRLTPSGYLMSSWPNCKTRHVPPQYFRGSKESQIFKRVLRLSHYPPVISGPWKLSCKDWHVFDLLKTAMWSFYGLWHTSCLK